MDYKEKYEAWRNSPHVPETVKFELNELAGDDRELRLRFAQDLKFGTAGLRGLLGAGTNRMNLCTVGWITAGIAKYMLQNRLDRRGVVIGRDSRLFSRDFAEYAARVFAGLGVRVYLFDDIRPTAEVSFAVRTLGAAFGVNVTASHNPKDYNGYKVYGADGVQITEEMAAKITESAGGDMIAPVCLCDLCAGHGRGPRGADRAGAGRSLPARGRGLRGYARAPRKKRVQNCIYSPVRQRVQTRA